MPANIEMDTGHIDAGISPGHEVIMPEARTFRTRKPKMASDTASRLPFIREPVRASWATSLLSVCRRCARWTITRPRNTQAMTTWTVTRGPTLNRSRGNQGHDDCNQQGQMDCPSRAGTTRSAVRTGNNVVVTDGEAGSSLLGACLRGVFMPRPHLRFCLGGTASPNRPVPSGGRDRPPMAYVSLSGGYRYRANPSCEGGPGPTASWGQPSPHRGAANRPTRPPARRGGRAACAASPR